MTVPRIIASPLTAGLLALFQAGWAVMATDLPHTCPPGQMRRICVELGALEGAVTFGLGLNLMAAARCRGHGIGWAAMATLNVVGVAVVYGLPDQTNVQPRGYPIEPSPRLAASQGLSDVVPAPGREDDAAG